MKKTGYDIGKVFEIEQTALQDEARAVFHEPRGNGKTGGTIPAWNLLPGCTCSGTACAHCLREGCYALKNLLRAGYNIDKNSCLKAWTENTVLVKRSTETFFNYMKAYLNCVKPEFFRIHASGDFFSVEYAEAWYTLAVLFPETRFLAFTKQWDIVRKVEFYRLPNFSLVLSGWTGCPVPEDLRRFYHVAWCNDGIETRIPEDALQCGGNCEECGLCWSLNTIGKDVKFDKH